jgi:hypothetical protein
MAAIYHMLENCCAAAISDDDSEHLKSLAQSACDHIDQLIFGAVIEYIARDIAITGSFDASR